MPAIYQGFRDAEVSRFRLAAGEAKEDEFDRLFGRSEPPAAPKQPGSFTQAFFSPQTTTPQKPSEALPGDSEPPAITPQAPLVSRPGEFTRLFSAVNVDAPPTETKRPEEREHPVVQSTMLPPSPGTLTELFAQQNQVSPPKPEPDAFNKFFHPDAAGPERTQSPASDFTPTFRGSGLSGLPSADLSARSMPLDSQVAERPQLDSPPMFADSNSRPNPEKATRIFSQPKPVVDQPLPASGPSAFTRIIASSVQRSAEESATPSSSNQAPQAPAPALPAPVAPVLAPQWSMGNASVPQIHPPAYPQQPPMPMQMPMPAVAPPAWPQPPTPPAMPSMAPPSMQPPQMPSEQPPQSALIAYLPLIVGGCVLLFLTSLIILIFALTRSS